MLGQHLTLWTIRLSLALYALVAAALLAGRPWSEWGRWKWVWAASCGLFLVHVLLAFHYYHDWSHARAVEHTAAETERLMGVRFGAGIYFNHLFAAVWTADALWWLADEGGRRRRGRVLSGVVHGYLFFIAFNGAVIFEDGPVRWAGVAVTLLLAALAVRPLLDPRRQASPDAT